MPIILSRLAIIGRAIIITLSFSLFFGCGNKEDEPQENLRLGMLEAVNELRQTGCQCGSDFMSSVPPLEWNDTLAISAEGHVMDMYTNNYFDHISPTMTSPIMRAQAAGYKGSYVGENIARGYNNIAQVVDAWKKSESHCKAMMDSIYNEMGAARYINYWVLELGKNK